MHQQPWAQCWFAQLTRHNTRFRPELAPHGAGEAGNIWSFNYFLYNRKQKRVLYFSCRGVSKTAGESTTPTVPVMKELLLQYDSVIMSACSRLQLINILCSMCSVRRVI